MIAAPRHRAVVLAAILVGYLLILIDVSILMAALPRIHADLGFSPTGLSWAHNAYTLTFGGLLLLGARAGYVLARRRTFMPGIGLFTAASLAVGLAQAPAWMIAARAVQGIGAATLAPSTLALLSASFPEGAERTRATAAYGALAGIGTAIGLIAGARVRGRRGHLSLRRTRRQRRARDRRLRGHAHGTEWISRLSVDTGYLLGIAVPMIVFGIGQGLGLSSLTTAGVAGVQPRDAAVAGGVVNVAHYLGGAVGLGILVTVFDTAGSASDGAQALLAERVSAALTAACLFLAAAIAVALAARTRRRAAEPRIDGTVAVAGRPRVEATRREDCAPA